MRAEALPLEQEALVVGDRNGLDFAAQSLERVAVNACKQAPLAPLELVDIACRDRLRKPPTHRHTLELERNQRLRHVLRFDVERDRKLGGRDGSETAEATVCERL